MDLIPCGLLRKNEIGPRIQLIPPRKKEERSQLMDLCPIWIVRTTSSSLCLIRPFFNSCFIVSKHVFSDMSSLVFPSSSRSVLETRSCHAKGKRLNFNFIKIIIIFLIKRFFQVIMNCLHLAEDLELFLPFPLIPGKLFYLKPF